MKTRREFSKTTKAAIRERSAGLCEVHLVPRCMYPALPEACKRDGAQVDHITPDWAGGDNSADNGAFLCGLCHKVKTVTDNKEAKRSARLRGEKGQQKRRRERKAAEAEPPSRKMGLKTWRPPNYVSQLNSQHPNYQKQKWRTK